MIFNSKEKFKWIKMYYWYELIKTEEVPEDNVLQFDFENGRYSITLKELKERARREVDNYKRAEAKKAQFNNKQNGNKS